MKEELARLGMGDFSDVEAESVRGVLLSIDLDKPAMFHLYGALPANAEPADKTIAMLERSPVTRLSEKLAQIIAKLNEADPRVVAKKPGFFGRIFGGAIEKKVVYQAAKKGIETLLAEADELAKEVKSVLNEIASYIAHHNNEVTHLHVHIAAGRLFLAQNPQAGKPESEEFRFEDNRERFSRRLTNLAALESSLQMTIVQLRLSRSQATDMLDRFAEVRQVLIPVWRQHTLSLLNSSSEDPQMIEAANKAHDALVAGLASSMNGLQKQA